MAFTEIYLRYEVRGSSEVFQTSTDCQAFFLRVQIGLFGAPETLKSGHCLGYEELVCMHPILVTSGLHFGDLMRRRECDISLRRAVYGCGHVPLSGGVQKS
jgi:hypothetical protein